MKRKILLGLLSTITILTLFTVTGCGKKQENKAEETAKNTEIKLTDKKDKGYVTTFKPINNFVQTNPKYNHVDNEELGIFLTFDYIESTKEAYDYAKTHNLFGNEYVEGQVKDYKWNKYDGYSYGIAENEMYFRILLEDNPDNSIVLTAYVGPKAGKDVDFANIFESEGFQAFLNTIEFTKESK